MATCSSVLAWRIPGTVEPDGLLSWGRTESDTTEGLSSSSRNNICNMPSTEIAANNDDDDDDSEY